MSLRVHYLQHVHFEGLGSIEKVLKELGYTISVTRLFNNEKLPETSSFDWLIIMGGPMGVYDEAVYPWLKAEKIFVKSAIDARKTVIGICLGAQLIADVMGAKVYKNKYREIGWFDITLNPDLTEKRPFGINLNHYLLKDVFPERTKVFHWHGDTFDIPEGAVPIASSEATLNQGFIYDKRVIALQFHLESTPDSARALIENCRDELDGSKYVQSEKEILSKTDRFENINKIMGKMIETIE